MSSLQDIYIRIDGIAGESKDAKHAGWIDVLAWRYRVSQSSSMHVGGGGGVGRAKFDAVTFSHYVDRATPNLMEYCSSGKHVHLVELSCCKAGNGSQEYMRVTLNDCIIVTAAPKGVTDTPRVIERVGISYSKIRVEVREQNANGSMGTSITGTWDVKQNIA